MDFLHYYAKKIDKNISEKIDVRDLFHYGDRIYTPWNTEPGFLSYKYCPSLWTLGARTNNNAEESNALIEEILTCANMVFDFVNEPDQKEKRIQFADKNKDKLYLKAYCELITYLRQLFSCYNEMISDDQLSDFVKDTEWGWVRFFKSIKDFEKITIITYNYDIWLERILKALGVSFGVSGFDDCSDKLIEVIKPHVSISFVTDAISKGYGVKYALDFEGLQINELRVQYTDLTQYDKSFIIPPAGDSMRLERCSPWSYSLREKAKNAALSIRDDDEIVLCGISYWHVDRRELDSLLISLNEDSHFTFINPAPSRDLNAVLTSVFKNYILQSSSTEIGVIVNGKAV